MIIALVSIFVLAGIGQFYWYQMHAPARPKVEVQDKVQREFLFQVDNYVTKNQGGQTVTMYFHYRYNDGIAEDQIPDYRKLRASAIQFMDTLDIVENPYWETITKNMCQRLKDNFPIEAISCQIQVASDRRQGLANEPGVHSSITTIGEIESLSFAK